MILKKAAVKKWLNGTTKVVRGIKQHHADQVNSSATSRFDCLIVFIITLLHAILTQTFRENVF